MESFRDNKVESFRDYKVESFRDYKVESFKDYKVESFRDNKVETCSNHPYTVNNLSIIIVNGTYIRNKQYWILSWCHVIILSKIRIREWMVYLSL